jgi:integrase
MWQGLCRVSEVLGEVAEAVPWTDAKGVVQGAPLPPGRQLAPSRVAWEQVTAAQLQQARAELARRFAPATVNKMLCATRGVLRKAGRPELARGLADFPRDGAVAVGSSAGSSPSQSTPAATAEQQPAGSPGLSRQAQLSRKRPLDWAAFEQLLGHCAADDRPAGRRDAALIAIVAGTGMQRQHLVRLDREDYDRDAGVLHGRLPLGGRARFYLSPSVQQAIEDWLATRGDEPGPLLLGIDKAGRLRWRQITDQSAYEILKRRAGKAGLGEVTSRALHYGPGGEPLERVHGEDRQQQDALVAELYARQLPYRAPAAAELTR